MVTNQEQARSWNGGEAAPRLVHEECYERTVAWVSEALHAALEPYATPGTPAAGHRAWLVTASRPWQ